MTLKGTLTLWLPRRSHLLWQRYEIVDLGGWEIHGGDVWVAWKVFILISSSPIRMVVETWSRLKDGCKLIFVLMLVVTQRRDGRLDHRPVSYLAPLLLFQVQTAAAYWELIRALHFRQKVVIVVEQRLEVVHLDHLVAAITVVIELLDQGVDSDRCLAMLRQQVLYLEVVQKLVLRQTQYLKRLRSRHKSTLDPESFLCNLFSASVCVFLRVESIVFFLQIWDDFCIPLLGSQGTALLILYRLIILIFIILFHLRRLAELSGLILAVFVAFFVRFVRHLMLLFYISHKLWFAWRHLLLKPLLSAINGRRLGVLWMGLLIFGRRFHDSLWSAADRAGGLGGDAPARGCPLTGAAQTPSEWWGGVPCHRPGPLLQLGQSAYLFGKVQVCGAALEHIRRPFALGCRRVALDYLEDVRSNFALVIVQVVIFPSGGERATSDRLVDTVFKDAAGGRRIFVEKGHHWHLKIDLFRRAHPLSLLIFHQRISVNFKLGVPRKDQLEYAVDLRRGSRFTFNNFWLFLLLLWRWGDLVVVWEVALDEGCRGICGKIGWQVLMVLNRIIILWWNNVRDTGISSLLATFCSSRGCRGSISGLVVHFFITAWIAIKAEFLLLRDSEANSQHTTCCLFTSSLETISRFNSGFQFTTKRKRKYNTQ